jgi:hypothetical protein
VRVRLAFHVPVLAWAVVVTTAVARADPQSSLGLTLGGAAQNVVGPGPLTPAVHLGGRADVLFFRNGPRDMGLGPYVDAGTDGFQSFDAGGGASWFLPVLDDLPFVVGAGAFARNGQGRSWSPGVEGTIFAGSRSYNFHSWYGMALGFFVQSRWLPVAPATMDVVLGVQVDAEVLALPVLFLVNGVRH